MKTTNKTTDMKDRKAMLSILWIFVMFNFTYIEIACLLFIVWYAWTWPRPEAGVISKQEEAKRQDGTGSEGVQVAGYVSDTRPIK